jgi:hypothetical protein
MSGRIRTVKPEWLEDELLAAASDEARVLSVALILMADDHGRGRASIASIASGAWCYQMEQDGGERAPEILARASRALHELVAIGFVRLYDVARQRYFELPNWTKHQRVDKPSKPRVPTPDHPDSRGIITFASLSGDSPESSRDTRETLAPDPDLRSPISDPIPPIADPVRASKSPEGVALERPDYLGPFGTKNIVATFSRIRSESWLAKRGRPGGRYAAGTRDYDAIHAAVDLFHADADPQASLEDSVRGFMCDPWAIGADWPFSTWAKDPCRYQGKAADHVAQSIADQIIALASESIRDANLASEALKRGDRDEYRRLNAESERHAQECERLKRGAA